MLRIPSGLRARKSVVVAATAALMLAAALPGSALAAGPDAPPLSSSVKSGAGPVSGGPTTAGDTANGNYRWDMFEGNAFTEGRLTAAGLSLVACLGGCAAGYVSEPIIVGFEGRYEGLKVGRPASADGGDVITFWLGDADNRVQAHQPTLFQGNSETRELHLSFEAVPADGAADGAATSTTAGAALSASGMTGGAADSEWRTTDLTLPDAADLGLVPANSAAGFAATTFRYQGIPLLPGLVTALGLTLAGVGVSLLMYRRRIAW